MADDVLELDDEFEAQADDELEVDEQADEELVLPTFGDDEGDAPAPVEDSSVIREMRAKLRDAQRELAEARKVNAPKPIIVGEKPTLESCEYDEDEYDTALLAWKDRKAEAEKQVEEADKRAEADRASWDGRAEVYKTAKAKLPETEFADAEAEVQERLPITHQNVLLMSGQSAALVYALGKNPAKLAELSKIENPILFAMAVGKLEDKLQMKARTTPDPDRPLAGNASPSINADKTLERLEKEADRTGDRTKVIEYRRSLKAKQ